VTFWGPGDRVLNLVPRAGVTDLRDLGLNERQIEALRLMVNEGREMTNREYRQMLDVSRPTAARDLRKLIATGCVQEVGKGRGLRYVAGMRRLGKSETIRASTGERPGERLRFNRQPMSL
jgi:DNA-binding Lrp family transcriptional regulator